MTAVIRRALVRSTLALTALTFAVSGIAPAPAAAQTTLTVYTLSLIHI